MRKMGFFRLSNNSHSLLLLLSIISYFSIYQVHAKVFHLDNYGLVGGGKVDNSKALLKAWGDVCGSKGEAQVEIPNGVYLTGPIQFKGPCKGRIRFRIKGTLRAPLGLKGNSFIDFQYIDRLTIDGGGSIDGQGRPKVGSPSLPVLLRFSFVTNSKVEHISLKNSQSTHFHLFGCNNTMINQISISSPSNSPNTDGIKLGVSQRVTISDSHIASGDDCVAILTGTRNLTVTGVTCGPGHGFSVGSLGTIEGDHVEDVLVKNCTLIGTMNGVRIKSKATKNKGLVRNVVFRDIVLKNAVGNPIIIDQNYCPPRTCQKGNSRVQISDVKYINIKGTSRTNIAVDLDCSGSNPCQDIELKDIDITYEGPGGAGQTSSKCSFVSGQTSGVQVPKSCFT